MKIKVITPSIFNIDNGVICAVSTRAGGVSEGNYGLNFSYKVGDDKENVRKNRKLFFEYLDISESCLVYQQQTHSDNIIYVTEPGLIMDNDALYTDVKNLFLCLTLADCLPVFLYHPSGVVAAIHSGWKGSLKQIVRKTVGKLTAHFGLNTMDILAYVGPGLSADNFQVGKDVADLFGKDVIQVRNGKLYLDNKLEIIRQLTSAGVLEKNIEISGLCTYKEKELFHSYRRDKEKSGRMLGIIGIKK
jgi:hypothetical protein